MQHFICYEINTKTIGRVIGRQGRLASVQPYPDVMCHARR